MQKTNQEAAVKGKVPLKAIAAVDHRWAIGNEGHMLARVPEDLAFFRRVTLGGRVICGSRTLKEFPGGQPLEDRENWVLSKRGPLWPKAQVFSSLEAVLHALETSPQRETWVIGGGSLYAQLLPWCDEALITRFDKVFASSDCWFPDLDAHPQWHLAERGAPRRYEGMTWRICRYLRCR